MAAMACPVLICQGMVTTLIAGLGRKSKQHRPEQGARVGGTLHRREGRRCAISNVPSFPRDLHVGCLSTCLASHPFRSRILSPTNTRASISSAAAFLGSEIRTWHCAAESSPLFLRLRRGRRKSNNGGQFLGGRRQANPVRGDGNSVRSCACEACEDERRVRDAENGEGEAKRRGGRGLAHVRSEATSITHGKEIMVQRRSALQMLSCGLAAASLLSAALPFIDPDPSLAAPLVSPSTAPSPSIPALSPSSSFNPKAAAAAIADIDDSTLGSLPSDQVEVLAFNAYTNRELEQAVRLLTELLRREPYNAGWLERRGVALVDLDRFSAAIDDFNRAAALQPNKTPLLLANRALAYEGLGRFEEALRDYSKVIQMSEEIGLSPPYIINSRGNCYASLGRWKEARGDYQRSARLFQSARNLSGAIYASSNAALALAQLGDDNGALREIETVARRAPGSIDMRAAQAAMFWHMGQEAKAEEAWEFACSQIYSGQIVKNGPILDGCGLYRDEGWVRRVRRWPPIMAERLSQFLTLKSQASPGSAQRELLVNVRVS